ncbi:LOW QUALITY PROTEIN: translation initiation factor IF-2-like [Camelus ferus]|uniref:LOW QUALITY PROTEIN: translation initiation factor IF-2-like n=1 Tax=Camelus ferus TaxID=419612 RepID=A0A8B8TEW2_CAMFR|nr:LOW QUALITY PROTEIN: translation initiation factor IF-2-like [Camelus ferus]
MSDEEESSRITKLAQIPAATDREPMWHCPQSFPACESSPHPQPLPAPKPATRGCLGVRFTNTLRVSAEPSGSGIQRLGEARDVLPRLPQAQRRAASGRIGTRPLPPPISGGSQEGDKCATQLGRRKPEPRRPSGKLRLSRPDPMHQKGSPGSDGLPRRPGIPGSGFTPRAPARSPAEPGSGGVRGSPHASRRARPARQATPPETPEESCAVAGPRAAPAARPCPAPARPSAYRSPLRLRPLRRRLPSLGPLRNHFPAPLTPGRLGPRRPRSRALSAPAAPWVRVGAAPQDAPLQPRAAVLRAGPAREGGVWAKGEEGGTRRGLKLGWREEETATSPEPGEAKMGRGEQRPPSTAGPRPPAGPVFPAPPLPALSARSCTRSSLPLGPRLHAALTLPGLFGSNLL